MNAKDVTIIILLLIVLAVLYKIMQGAKLQTQLATGMAKKMGVEIPKEKTRAQLRAEQEEEETEDTEHEEQEEEEEDGEEEGEDENQESEEEEVEVQEEDAQGKRIGMSKAVVLRVSKPKKAKKEKKPKLKAYEQMATIFTDAPLQSGEMMERYTNEFGEVSSNDFWLTLNYSIKKGLVKKYQISETPKKNIYGLPEMFDGDELKEEHKENLPK